MKPQYLILIAALATLGEACSASKKAAAPVAKNDPVTAPPMPPPRPANGIYAPGEAELAAIRSTDKSASLETLKEGYTIYTGAACTKCHGAKNIYSRSTEAWPRIIDEMAPRARLTDTEKDAVLKYVLAIKAAQKG